MRMRDFRNRRFFVAIIAVFVLVLMISIYGLTGKSIRRAYVERLNAVELAGALDENRWKELIRTDGGQQAYEEFAQSVAQLPAIDQHTAAHMFGSALYDQMGLPGLAICDQRFFGGCFHQFLGKALVDHGYGIIPQLVSVCTLAPAARSLSCAHGVGHGLVTEAGYQRTNLTTALTGCDSFPVNNRPACYKGAFMEYQERTVLGPDAGIATFKGNWYEPCDSLSGMQYSLCLFNQSQWWWDILQQGSSSQEEIIKKIGELCEKSGSEASIKMCFGGMGNTFGFRLETDLAAKACIDSYSDSRRTLLCIESLARREQIGGDPSLKACSFVTDAQRTECETYVQNTPMLIGDYLQLSQ